MSFRARFADLSTYINGHFVAELPRDIRSLRFDATGSCVTTELLLLNTLLGQNTLLAGDSGTGKTHLATTVMALAYQLPIQLFRYRPVVGAPGATINEIYATHDIAAVNAGRDEAFLYLPFHLPALLIDEVNRYTELEQNRIRAGVSSNVWSYANHAWHIDDQVVLAAMNPEWHNGTFPLNQNLVDTFVCSLPPPQTNPFLHDTLITGGERAAQELLGDVSSVREFIAFYEKQKTDADAMQVRIRELQERTVASYERRGIPLIHNGDIAALRSEVFRIEKDAEASFFTAVVHAESVLSRKYGALRSEDPVSDSTHDQQYAGVHFQSPLLGRFAQSWERTAQAIAWLRERDVVGIPDLVAAYPYAAAHRIEPSLELHQEVLNAARDAPVQFAVAGAIIGQIHERYIGFVNNPGLSRARNALIDIASGQATSGQRRQELLDVLALADHPVAIWASQLLTATGG